MINTRDYDGLPISRYVRSRTDEDDRRDAEAIRADRNTADKIQQTVTIVERETDDNGGYREPDEYAELHETIQRCNKRLANLEDIAAGREQTGTAARELYENMQLRFYGNSLGLKEYENGPWSKSNTREQAIRDAEEWDQQAILSNGYVYEEHGIMSMLAKAQALLSQTQNKIDRRRQDWQTCLPTYRRWIETTQPVAVHGLKPAEQPPKEPQLTATQRLAWELVRDPNRHGHWLELDTGRGLTDMEARTLVREWQRVTVHGHRLEVETYDQERQDGHHVLIRYTAV